MTQAASVARLSTEFDDFLFAPISVDRQGMPLSVLSALARLNLDPWQQAAELASLPREAAIERLASLIAELPGGTPTRPGPPTNTATLIELLPHRKGLPIVSREGSVAVSGKPNSLAIVYVIVMIVMLGTQWVFAMRQQPTEADSLHAPVSGNVSPRTSLSGAERSQPDGRGDQAKPRPPM
jgi:hypothetical protein